MTGRMVVLLVVVAAALAIAYVTVRSLPASQFSTPASRQLQPIDAQLAAKAQDHCWFKVKNRSGRTDKVRQWQSVTSIGAKTDRLGDLLIVTGAIEPMVGDDHFYGCSLFEYTAGSPVVMSVVASGAPVRVDMVIPYGFSADGREQQR
jgi:hypothetical protein